MVQNPHHYPWCHAPSPVQDCPAGADKHRWGVAGNDKGRRAASSQARLVADEVSHLIGKIQPQLIMCNPPNQMQSSLTGAILPMGRILSEALRRERASPTTHPSTATGTEPRLTLFVP